MNCVGLAEATVQLLKDYGIQLIDGGINDVREMNNCLNWNCFCSDSDLCHGHLSFIARDNFHRHWIREQNPNGPNVQHLRECLLALIWDYIYWSPKVSILSHFVGTLLPISATQRQRGVVGYSLSVFLDNIKPDFRGSENFITMFGLYFPAMTGEA